MSGSVSPFNASDALEIKGTKKCYVILKSYTSKNEDYCIMHGRETSIVKDIEGARISGATKNDIGKHINNMWKYDFMESNPEASLYEQGKLMEMSCVAYNDDVSAIKSARMIWEYERSMSVSYHSACLMSVDVYKAEARGWEIEAQCLRINRYDAILVETVDIVEHVVSIDEGDEKGWYEYPAITPPVAGMYFVTVQRDWSRSVERQNIFWDGDKFLTCNDIIVAWMEVPPPYLRGRFGEAQ